MNKKEKHGKNNNNRLTLILSVVMAQACYATDNIQVKSVELTKENQYIIVSDLLKNNEHQYQFMFPAWAECQDAMVSIKAADGEAIDEHYVVKNRSLDSNIQADGEIIAKKLWKIEKNLKKQFTRTYH